MCRMHSRNNKETTQEKKHVRVNQGVIRVDFEKKMCETFIITHPCIHLFASTEVGVRSVLKDVRTLLKKKTKRHSYSCFLCHFFSRVKT